MWGCSGKCWEKETAGWEVAVWRPQGEEASPALHSCVTTAGTALTPLGATSPLDGPCHPAVWLPGVLPVQAERGRDPRVGRVLCSTPHPAPEAFPLLLELCLLLLNLHCLGAGDNPLSAEMGLGGLR